MRKKDLQSSLSTLHSVQQTGAGPSVAERDGDGISGIIGLGHSLQTEDPPGHVLNLVLGGVAVAHNETINFIAKYIKAKYARYNKTFFIVFRFILSTPFKIILFNCFYLTPKVDYLIKTL